MKSIFETNGREVSQNTITQMTMQNQIWDNLQRQSIQAPLVVIRECFDEVNNIGDVEFLTGNENERLHFEPTEYQVLMERPLHSHDYLELMFVSNGAVKNTIEDQDFIYREGQGCIMNSNIRHKEISVGKSEVIFFEMKESFVKLLLSIMQVERTEFKNLQLKDFLRSSYEEKNAYTKQYCDFSPTSADGIDPALSSLLSEMLTALYEKQAGFSYMAPAVILKLLNKLGDPSRYYLQTVSSKLDKKEFIASKIELLVKASYGQINMQELEDNLAYNGDYLNRLFKLVHGKSISAYSSEVRMDEIKRLLKETELSVEEIMVQLNITSRGYFFAQFKKETGMTPRVYREKNQNGADLK